MPHPECAAAFSKLPEAARVVLKKLDRSYAVPAAVVSILLSLPTIALSLYTINQSTHPPVMFQDLCIDCADLPKSLISQPEVSGFSRRLDNGTEMCCAENQEQMTALLQACIREQVSDSDDDSNSSLLPVSAHKLLRPANESESKLTAPYFNGGREHFQPTFNKTFHDPATEHVHGVEVLGSALRIISTGVYYVYVSVHIDPQFNISGKEITYQSWLPYVFRESPNNPVNTGRILQMAYTTHGDSFFHEETVYAGGTFLINKGDELQVCISGLGLIRYNSESSFLGIVKLNSDLLEE